MKKIFITAGVDEVGRGCLAGPVVAAAVILKKGINLKILRDSKKISYKKREKIAEHIKQNSYFGIGVSSVEEIQDLNILQAALLSMKRAIDELEIKPELILVDGNFAPKGMIRLSEKYSNYAWESNFGYGTKAHLDGLKKFGITSHHRKSFKPIHKILSR